MLASSDRISSGTDRLKGVHSTVRRERRTRAEPHLTSPAHRDTLPSPGARDGEHGRVDHE